MIRYLFLGFIGLCAGGVIAAGVFAFLVMIGVFPRLIGKTSTKKYILLYETVIIAGGVLGNLADLYEPFLVVGEFWGQLLLGIFGTAVGIFTGCLFMSLAETLKALPTVARRIRLAVGLPWLILALALGKLTGSLIYFINGFG